MPREPTPRAAPILPADRRAYLDLLGRIIEAPSREALIALQRELVEFEGGRFEDDFLREWVRSWWHVVGEQVLPPELPPPGPLSRRARKTSS